MSNSQRGAHERDPTEKSRTDTKTATSEAVAVHPSDLTQFQINVLAILAEGADYGLGIKRELEEYYQEEINHGRLYPNLDKLVEKGLIQKSELDKRTNEYELSKEGRQVVADRAKFLLAKQDTEEIAAER